MKTKEKTYACIDEFAREFTSGFAEVPTEVKSLWDSIVEYGDAVGEHYGEGNSGEFSDEREQKRIEKVLDEKTELLIENFGKFTGYRPVFVMNKIYPIYIKNGKNIYGTNYQGAWDFTNLNDKS